MTDLDVKRERIAMYVKWGLAIAGAAIAAPVAYLAIKGIVGLAIAAAIGMVVIGFAQPFAHLIATWRMKAIVAIAQANPIETMRDLFLEKSRELARSEAAIQEFDTEIRNFADQLDDFKAEYPDEADKYDELLAKMKEALANMKSEQKNAVNELAKFQQAIKKAEAIYKMALAAARVTKLSGKAESQVFAQIRQQVAVDSVRTQLNRAFAGLDSALERRAVVQQSLPAARTVTVIEADTREPSRVKRS